MSKENTVLKEAVTPNFQVPVKIGIEGFKTAICLITCESNSEKYQEAIVELCSSDKVNSDGYPPEVAKFRDYGDSSNEGKIMKFEVEGESDKRQTYLNNNIKLPLTFFVQCGAYNTSDYTVLASTPVLTLQSAPTTMKGELHYVLLAEDQFDNDNNDVVMKIRFIGQESI